MTTEFDSTKIILFIKSPRLGEVKTRIAESWGNEAALNIYRALVRDVLKLISGLLPCIRIYTDFPEKIFPLLPFSGEPWAVFRQKGKSLGPRMDAAFQETFSAGAGKALLFGSDIPGITEKILSVYAKALISGDTVLGPARDGGYYLIGFRHDSYVAALFSDIPWSTGQVYALTRKKITDLGMTCFSGPIMRDIDTLEDLEFIRRNQKLKQFIPNVLKEIEKLPYEGPCKNQ